MPFVGHLPEVFVVLLIGLLVFGPKRMIEMGSTLGRMFRELRESLRDIPGMGGVNSLGSLLQDDTPRRTPLANASQLAQSAHLAASEPTNGAAAPAAMRNGQASPPTPAPTPAADAVNSAPFVVEASVEHVEEHPED
jgi:Sec-independent protein translocase protein TatA